MAAGTGGNGRIRDWSNGLHRPPRGGVLLDPKIRIKNNKAFKKNLEVILSPPTHPPHACPGVTDHIEKVRLDRD